jgi:hypothetical protein
MVIGRSADPKDRGKRATIAPATKKLNPIRITGRRPNRSDNGPTTNCPTAKIAR